MRNQISMLRTVLDKCINKNKRRESNAGSHIGRKEMIRIEQTERDSNGNEVNMRSFERNRGNSRPKKLEEREGR